MHGPTLDAVALERRQHARLIGELRRLGVPVSDPAAKTVVELRELCARGWLDLMSSAPSRRG